MVKPNDNRSLSVRDRLKYLSWSKLNIWEKDPNLFYQVYVEGLEQFRTPYIELGKRLASALEDGHDEGGNPLIEHLVTFLPSYPEREFAIDTKFEGIPLKGVLDSFDPKGLRVIEYKSGKRWTQGMVDSNGQLTFYALLVWLKYGKLPNSTDLYWARTVENEDLELMFTGEMQGFKTHRSMKDVVLMGGRIHRAWKGIQQMARDFKL